MVKSIVKTAINAVWVILVCLEICQVIPPSQVFGYILIAVYIGVLAVTRPMDPLIKAIREPDKYIPIERQTPNKVYSFVLLMIKIFLLLACIGIIISGAILYRSLLLRSLAIKIHFLCTYWVFLAAAVQLGVNVNITLILKLNNTFQKACYYAAYAGAFIGIIICLQSTFVFALFSFSEDLASITVIQGLLMLIGLVSVGISISHIFLKLLTK